MQNHQIFRRTTRREAMLQLLAGGCALAAGRSRAAAPATSPDLHAILLGTQGGPNYTLTRAETASVVALDDRLYMVDCGYGALAGLIHAGLNYRNVGHVFLTHLHDDHTADLAALMMHQWTGGRVTPTVVHGPTGTRKLVAAAIQYNRENEEIRLIDESRSARVKDLFSAVEIPATAKPVTAFEDGDLRISAVENTHYPEATKRHTRQRSLALRFDARGHSITFSGDTAYSENLVALARGADVLVCEAMHFEATRANFDKRVAAGAYADNPEGIWNHIAGTHSSLTVVGRMAREAGVRTLVLNHIIPGGLEPEFDDDFYRREAAREFSGRIIVGSDGLQINPSAAG
jgi:ribonuclease BN (tRNA processing enzyme)